MITIERRVVIEGKLEFSYAEIEYDNWGDGISKKRKVRVVWIEDKTLGEILESFGESKVRVTVESLEET